MNSYAPEMLARCHEGFLIAPVHGEARDSLVSWAAASKGQERRGRGDL